MRRLSVVLATFVATVALVTPAAPIRAASLGEFFYPCSVTGQSAGYDYVGSCRVAADRSVYRYPTLYRDGIAQPPSGTNQPVHLYYRDPSVTGVVNPFPAGLNMRVGDPSATSAQSKWTKRIFWQCGDTKATTHYATPPNCPNNGDGVYDTLTLIVKFPYCWNGVGTDTASMSWPVKSRCPSAFPFLVPQVQIHVQWAIEDGATAQLTLATGSIYGEHGWFQNGWDSAGLTTLIHDCIQAGTSCHL